MIIDFKDAEPTVENNFKGGEKQVILNRFDDNLNRIMKASLEPGASIGHHRHDTNSEIIYIIKGRAKITYDGCNEEILNGGGCHYCPKGHSHSLLNIGNKDLVLLAVIPKQ